MISLKQWCLDHSRLDILDRWSNSNHVTPDEISYGSISKFEWICEQGHTWKTTPNKLTQKTSSGCPYCSNQKVWEGFNDLKTLFPSIAAQWNIEKNGELRPSQITTHSNKKVWWICSNGHEYQCSVSQRTRRPESAGCPYCTNKKLLTGFNDLATICPSVAQEWHPTKNENLKPTDVLSSINRKAWWICPNGHEYQATINNRVIKGKQRTGCPICSNKIIISGINDLATFYPHLISEWHPAKNGNIHPQDIGCGSHKKYWWICPLGHEYQASPENRAKENGTGCPICANERQTSFAEQCIFYYVKSWFSDAISRYKESNYEIDVFIPSLKLGIEYDGYRFHTENFRERELSKDDYYKSKNIRIIRIKEYRSKHPEYKNQEIIWIESRGNQSKHLEKVLYQLAALLNCTEFICDINIDRDAIQIINQYYFSVKENSLLSCAPEIAKEWDYQLNGNLKPYQVSFGSGKKVWWRCPNGHSYTAPITSRTGPKGSGCPICAGQQLLTGYNDLQSRYPAIASEWDIEKNENLSPSQVMPFSRKKVWWKCSKGHSYKTTIASRVNRKSGCPYCSGLKAVVGVNDFKTLFPQIAQEWIDEKNGSICPDNLSPYTHTKAWWRCPNNHEYFTSVSNRTTNLKKTNGNGCPYCAGSKILSGYNDLATKLPEIVKYWHPTKNGVLTPEQVGMYSSKKVWWITSDGAETFQRIDSFVIQYQKSYKKLLKLTKKPSES